MPASPSGVRSLTRHHVGACLVLLAFAFTCGQANAYAGGASIEELKSLSLEELFELPVTSVTRAPQPLGRSASGIYVIREDMIEASPYMSLPEVLRLAPNLHVAQRSANSYSITARGFRPDSDTTNKLLVLSDGRTLYSPVFSGVFWDTQQVFLPDIDRIEVVSGPGGSTWGANAVNGVINIISKSAEDTQGVYAYGGTGNINEAIGGVRYGDRIGEDLHYRVYAMHSNWENSLTPSGARSLDGMYLWQGGFRTDWTALPDDTLTLQGDAYTGKYPRNANGQPAVEGANILGRWTHTFSPDSDMYLRAYVDHADRDSPGGFADRVTTSDLELQHRFLLAEKHEIIWGGNYRYIQEDIRSHGGAAILPPTDSFAIGAVFVQDSTRLRDDLTVTMGVKVEDHYETGLEYQPTLRLAYQPESNHTLWAAVSRAARTPSRIDLDYHIPGQPPYLVVGGPDFQSEILYAYELGWRGSPRENVSGALTLYYHDYSHLRSIDNSAAPWTFSNDVEGNSYGLEASLDWDVIEDLRLSLGYTYMQQDLEVKEGRVDLAQARSESSNPDHWFSIHANWDINAALHSWISLRFVDELPIYTGRNEQNPVPDPVPSYFEVDAKISWDFSPNLQFSLIGQNLLDEAHAESNPLPSRLFVERSVLAVVRWRH